MDSCLFKNFDAKFDLFNTEFEKKIGRLPDEMRFIRKIIYYTIFPRVETYISQLEELKTSPNYDDHLISLKPSNVIKSNGITCLDMFENHNIKKMKSNKLIYATYAGAVVVYDQEQQKVVVEKSLPNSARVDILETATVKYFDTYVSRIAVYQRGETNVTMLTFNHVFPILNTEVVISLSDDKTVSLGNLVAGIRVSKDSFFMGVISYSGSIRVYKFNDIPEQNKGNQLYTFLFNVEYTQIENFSLIDKEEEIKDSKDKKLSMKEKPKIDAKKPADIKKPGDKKNEVVIPDEIYIKTSYEDNMDLTPLRKYCQNHPFITFIQKKLIFEDKVGGFCSSLLTAGIYVSFYGTNNLKFISLTQYYTDNMKTIFKVMKSKGASSQLSVEEQISLNTNMNKKEKEYINYLRAKLDNPQVTNNNQPELKRMTTKADVKPVEKLSIKNPPIIQETKNELNEVNYFIIFPTSFMIGQRYYSSNNYIGIGMKDGSIIVWDVELHTDKYLFQAKREEITTLCLDDKFLIAGTIDGQIFTYNLENGEEIYKSYNFPYMNYPVVYV
jgi:hypothetical protein